MLGYPGPHPGCPPDPPPPTVAKTPPPHRGQEGTEKKALTIGFMDGWQGESYSPHMVIPAIRGLRRHDEKSTEWCELGRGKAIATGV